MKYFVITALTIFGLFSCSKKNLPTYKISIDGMISLMEAENRENWQKPDVILDYLGKLKSKKVYDLGSGTGYFATQFSENGASVIAADPDDRFLDYLKDKIKKSNIKNIETRKIPFDNPKLKSREVDIIFCANTYHIIENRISYLEKLKLGLKDDGQIMLVNHKKIESPNGPPINKRLKMKIPIEELEKSGFTITLLDSISLPENYIIIAKKRKDEI